VRSHHIIKIFVLLLMFLPITANAARLPSAQKVQTISQKFFHKYGQKYPDTIFGQKNLDSVQIHAIREISYKVVYADVVLLFKDGKVARALIKLTQKFPKGWLVSSWEMAAQGQGQ